MITKEIPVNDEQVLDTLFDVGDIVDVIANKNDTFKDFLGVVIGYTEEGLVKVRNYDGDVFVVGENQCAKA